MDSKQEFPHTRLIRLSSILGPVGPIPVSKSTWYAHVKSGRYPQPVKLTPFISAWREEDIRALVERGAPFASETTLVAKQADPPRRKGS